MSSGRTGRHIAHIDRLRHIRSLITRAGRYDTSGTRLILFSGAGFNGNAVSAAASASDIALIGLTDLYGWPRGQGLSTGGVGPRR